MPRPKNESVRALSMSLIAPGRSRTVASIDRQRRRFAAAQDEIAERDLLGGEVVGDALVDVLVMAAEERELLEPRETLGVGVARTAAARREEDDRGLRADRLDGLEERRGLHHHARAAAVGRVVHGAVLVVRVVAQVDELVAYQPAAAAARGDREAERALEELREDGDDADGEHRAHSLPPVKSSSGIVTVSGGRHGPRGARTAR